MTTQLLSSAERNAVHRPAGDFVEAFIQAQTLKTDAAPYLLEAGALMALSLAAGDTVTAPKLVGGDGPLHLNLYLLIVGPSTTTRKTTILNSVRGILPVNAQSRQSYVVILDDTSIQAFNKNAAAAGMAQAPVVLAVDEVAGMFGESRRASSYLKGFDTALMKAYGHDPIRVSRTGPGGDVIAERGAFVSIFAASTPDPLAEVLGAEDIASGLLPRFLIFDATDTEPAPRRSLMERRDTTDEYRQRVDSLQAHLAAIAHGRACGIPINTEADGKTTNYRQTSLAWSDEAVERLDELDHLIRESQGTDDDVDAILGRSFEHACKLSALYALSRGGQDADIELGDVLRALKLIETTTSDLITMRHTLGGNRHERDVSKVCEMLANAPEGRVALSRISTECKLDYRDTRAVIDTLKLRGLGRLDGNILMRPGARTAFEKRVDKARAYVDSIGGWVSSTDLDAATGKRGKVGAIIDAMVSAGPYEDEVQKHNNGRRVRRLRAK